MNLQTVLPNEKSKAQRCWTFAPNETAGMWIPEYELWSEFNSNTIIDFTFQGPLNHIGEIETMNV